MKQIIKKENYYDSRRRRYDASDKTAAALSSKVPNDLQSIFLNGNVPRVLNYLNLISTLNLISIT